MKTVKISDAKNNLSRYLKYVQKGGRVRVLDRDRPVADIVPVPEAQGGTAEERHLADLERRGIIKRGSRGPIPAELLRPGPADPEGLVLQSLIEERRSGR